MSPAYVGGIFLFYKHNQGGGFSGESTSTYMEIGALRGLIGKFGIMPARSRHCNGE